MDHATIVKGLLDPEAYPHSVGEIVHLQTHISSILLTGDRAYKIKKPVDFGFLNFSTLDLRELNCRREVELNGRLALFHLTANHKNYPEIMNAVRRRISLPALAPRAPSKALQ